MDKKGIYILPHPGLGDHILCAGIYREYSSKYFHCVVPVVTRYREEVRAMLKDVSNIQVISYGSELQLLAHRDFLRKCGYDVLNLGSYGSDWFNDETRRLDANYYDQAGLSLDCRWNSFRYVRNKAREHELFNMLQCDGGEYIFVHDDARRNFNIDQSKLPTGVRIVRPDLKFANSYRIFDYLKIIENATEIHCIESSFCALIESLEIPLPKFAHRYARPEAKADRRLEFTYRSEWEVLL
jgi:hypothetical protein